MRIKDIAERYHVSRQRVYQVVKSAGLSIDKLVDQKTKELTTAGERELVKLFDSKTDSIPADNLTSQKEAVKRLSHEVELLRQQNAMLLERIEDYKRQIDQQQEQIRISENLVSQSQIIAKQAMDRIPRTFKERLFGRKQPKLEGSKSF